MKLSTHAFPPTDNDNKSKAVGPYHYDLRLEIGVKEATETIQVATIFHDLVTRMKAASNAENPLEVLTTDDQVFSEQTEMSSEEFQKAFKVDKTEGKFQKVLLGFKIRTMIKLYDLKQRLMPNYLNAHNLFLREHVGGFTEGVKVFSYGFLKDDHPDHPDIPALTTRFTRWISDAWKKMDKEDKQKWKEELPQVFFGPTGIAIPVNFSKEKVSATVEGKTKLTTAAIMVTTPSKYGPLLRELLDSAVLNKRINNLIPLAYSREDPEGYYNILVNQERFMDTHRNIPILHALQEAATSRGIKGATLTEVLYTNKDVLRVTHDQKHDKFHVSTSAAKYKALHQWIVKIISEHKFPYSPYVRPLKYGNDTAKFSTVLSAATSVASVTDASTKTARGSPWKQRPPLNISYVLSPEAFPALPKVTPQVPPTPSTTSETFDEDTIQSAITSALTKLEAQHKAELDALKHEMQDKMDKLEAQMQEMSQKVAVQTYQALIKEESPLATKTDHAQMQHEINVVSKQLSTLIQLFQNGTRQNATPESPPRTTKRTKPSSTPEKNSDLVDLFTQETAVPSATSDPDEGMEGCDD